MVDLPIAFLRPSGHISKFDEWIEETSQSILNTCLCRWWFRGFHHLNANLEDRQIFQQHSPIYIDLIHRNSWFSNLLCRHEAFSTLTITHVWISNIKVQTLGQIRSYLHSYLRLFLSDSCGIIDKRSSRASSVGVTSIFSSVSESFPFSILFCSKSFKS